MSAKESNLPFVNRREVSSLLSLTNVGAGVRWTGYAFGLEREIAISEALSKVIINFSVLLSNGLLESNKSSHDLDGVASMLENVDVYMLDRIARKAGEAFKVVVDSKRLESVVQQVELEVDREAQLVRLIQHQAPLTMVNALYSMKENQFIALRDKVLGGNRKAGGRPSLLEEDQSAKVCEVFGIKNINHFKHDKTTKFTCDDVIQKVLNLKYQFQHSTPKGVSVASIWNFIAPYIEERIITEPGFLETNIQDQARCA